MGQTGSWSPVSESPACPCPCRCVCCSVCSPFPSLPTLTRSCLSRLALSPPLISLFSLCLPVARSRWLTESAPSHSTRANNLEEKAKFTQQHDEHGQSKTKAFNVHSILIWSEYAYQNWIVKPGFAKHLLLIIILLQLFIVFLSCIYCLRCF